MTEIDVEKIDPGPTADRGEDVGDGTGAPGTGMKTYIK